NTARREEEASRASPFFVDECPPTSALQIDADDFAAADPAAQPGGDVEQTHLQSVLLSERDVCRVALRAGRHEGDARLEARAVDLTPDVAAGDRSAGVST